MPVVVFDPTPIRPDTTPRAACYRQEISLTPWTAAFNVVCGMIASRDRRAGGDPRDVLIREQGRVHVLAELLLEPELPPRPRRAVRRDALRPGRYRAAAPVAGRPAVAGLGERLLLPKRGQSAPPRPHRLQPRRPPPVAHRHHPDGTDSNQTATLIPANFEGPVMYL